MSSIGLATPPQIGDAAPTTTCSAALATFLSTSKVTFLTQVREAPEDAKKWTLVTGNEAGDLDSIASAIGYAWFLSQVNQQPAIPLIQIAKEDFILRAENLFALSLAGIPDPQEYLLSPSDLCDFHPDNFALVDHNRLGAQYAGGKVVGVIDHHEDEGLYMDTAVPRLIKPCGSCASLVASQLPPDLPAELATLLLSAILIDTAGLKPGGKATDDDRLAAVNLAVKSTLGISHNLTDVGLRDVPAIKNLSKELGEKKNDLSHLSGWDLLRRDYKESTYILPWADGQPAIKVGLATVPVQLKVWGSDGKLETDSLAWMKKRDLTILGVLTTFREEKDDGKEKKKDKKDKDEEKEKKKDKDKDKKDKKKEKDEEKEKKDKDKDKKKDKKKENDDDDDEKEKKKDKKKEKDEEKEKKKDKKKDDDEKDKKKDKEKKKDEDEKEKEKKEKKKEKGDEKEEKKKDKKEEKDDEEKDKKKDKKKEKEKDKKDDKEKEKDEGKKGKHAREQAWIILDNEGSSVDVNALAARLWQGLEEDTTLQLKPHKNFAVDDGKTDKLPPNSKIRVYKQKNADATRKAVAPLVKTILEKPDAKL
ncbi:exopolyphosphatase [Coprinopsis cinerea okayama7|uniref:Exopolyphosphatase n=1 Tax=Coprinopsis cinerea (strain Okayama-7 / 130 / ATCC MYA-4618 / FGSC 9003) TaxID=240176 RepID=A8NZZ7_COPC7|nr:exopolyphosphatase [Coprinopsis cinerea okayama7\|eukprot:XP_001837785.2 exopolyphosphatase [Coprinopsis cinerea okayama7\